MFTEYIPNILILEIVRGYRNLKKFLFLAYFNHLKFLIVFSFFPENVFSFLTVNELFVPT